MKKALPLAQKTAYKVFAGIFTLIFLMSEASVFGQAQSITYSTAGTYNWTAPSCVTSITVKMWGGGGAGGGNSANNSRGGGGGAGGTYVSTQLSVIPGITYNLRVGTGGNGDQNSGDKGQDSRFRDNNNIVMVFADGGNGGSAPNGNTTVNGGTGTAGSSYVNGGTGTVITAGTDGQTGNNSRGGAGGNGGNPGGGAGGNAITAEGDGNNGFQPGGGGGGAFIPDNSNHDGGDGGDGMIIIEWTGLRAGYCAVGGNNTEPITYVNFSGINYTSSNVTGSSNTTTRPAYESICQTATVSPGSAYPIIVNGNTDGNYINYVTVFIDWDQDGNMNENGERYYIGVLTNTNGNTVADQISASIAVPASALPGITKMRVYKYYRSGSYNTSKFEDNSCDNFDYGQVEDYLVNVVSCSQPTHASAETSTIPANNSAITICSGTNVTLKPVGGILGAGQTWKWYSGSCGGTAVTGVASDGSVVVAPSATTTYYVRIEGSACGSSGSCRTVTVNVNQPGTITHSSGSQNIGAACKGVAITPIVFTVGGGASNASVSWSPSVPTGISGTYSSGSFTISGTPGASVVPGEYTYTINVTGSNAPCTNQSITGTITVTGKPAISYPGGPFTYCLGATITTNTPTINSPGLTTSFAAITALPAGLSLNAATGAITGIPTGTASGPANYTIRATNDCGFTDVVINMAILAGNAVFNISSPASPLTICSSGSIVITLGNSEAPAPALIQYQLYRDGVPVPGTVVAGTGAAINFPAQNVAGTYTVVAITNCPTNMNGSVVLNVTPTPVNTISYIVYRNCRAGFSDAAVISGTPSAGTFSASPAGLVFSNTSTGVINLGASSPGSYTVTYTVPAFGECAAYSTTAPYQIEIIPSPDVYDVTGGGSFCTGSAGLPVGLSYSQNGVQYTLNRVGDPAFSEILTGTGAPLSFSAQTVAGTYTIRADLGNCTEMMDGQAVIVVNPGVNNVNLTPATATICQGKVIPLTAATATSVTTQTVSATTGSITTEIPNNNAVGISSLLKFSGVPAGATINWVAVKFYITHNNVSDLRINLKGPNGNVLNIVNRRGGGNDNFGSGLVSTPTTVASNGASSIALINPTPGGDPAPFTARAYLPEADGGIQGATIVAANLSNVASFFDLFGAESFSANGNWILSVCDLQSGTTGNLRGWTLEVNYTKENNPASVTWASALDLYTDPATTNPYTGEEITHVYAKPQISGNNIPVTATLTNEFGCSKSATSFITVSPSPQITVTADYCNPGGTAGTVRITATSTVDISSWVWSVASEGASANFARSSYIEVRSAGTFYISAIAAGYPCAGTGVMKISQELVNNGDFELGNIGFSSDYAYHADNPSVNNELVPDHDNNGYGVGEDGQFYHNNFWGVDHTYANGTGKYMLVNGHGIALKVWEQENITVVPGTTYYFSGYANSLNTAGNYGRLQFQIFDGTTETLVGSEATLAAGGDAANPNGGLWKKFWGQWTAPAGVTEITLRVRNNQTALGGNDFGIDDLSFGTMSVFFNVTSPSADLTVNNNGICEGTPIKDIVMEYGGNGLPPTLLSGSLPNGVTVTDHGRVFRISGTPAAGSGGTGSQTYTFTYQLSTACGVRTVTQSIRVLAASNPGTVTGTPLIAACYESAGTVPVSGNIGNLTWQSSADSISWTNVSNGDYGPSLTAERFFRVSAKNETCPSSTPTVVKVAIKNMWTGKSSIAWNNSLNWSDRIIPEQLASPCGTTVIPVVASGRYPELTTGMVAKVNNLRIESGAPNIRMLNGSTLQIAGSVLCEAGDIDANNGTIEMNGVAGTQSISGSWFTGKNVKRLLVSNNLNVSNTPNDTLNILEKLSFENSSTADLNTGNNITLKSTADKTASIGILNTGNIITGRFTVERFIRHYQNWHLVTLPVRENISVYNSWQEGLHGAPLTSNGYGTRITGPVTPPSTGFDSNTPGYSLKWWNPSLNSGAGNWSNVINTTTENPNRPQGFFLFVRGDRGYAAPPGGSVTTLRGSGAIYDANNLPSLSNVTTTAANTWFSLANPYASAIGINKLETANSTRINPNIWVWDPTLWGYYSVGGYQTITKVTGYRATPGNTTGSTVYNSTDAYPSIQSGQAVFVQSKTALSNATISFAENMKEDGSMQANREAGTGTNGNIDPDEVVMLSTHLYYADGRMLDGNRVVFDDNYSSQVDFNDADKFNNSNVNFGLKRFNRALAVEARPSLKATDTLYYNMSGLPTGNFKLGVSVQNIYASHLNAELIDNYLNSRTPVSLTDSSFISFSTTNDAASKAANRFMMVFRSSQVVLPVTFVQVAAQRNADRSIDVQWKVANEVNIIRYEVERSADGRTFSGILSRDAASYDTYRQTDLSPLAQDNFYRIKAIGLAGDITYSNVVKVAPDKSPALIVVSPNPVKGKQMNVRFMQQPAGEYLLVLTNNAGQEIYRGSVRVNSNSLVKTIALHPSSAGGTYRLAVYNKKGDRVSTEMIMVE